MADNLLGTDIVVLSTQTYRAMLEEVEVLKKQIETYEKAFKFNASWDNTPEVKVDLEVFDKAIRQAWEDYVPHKDDLDKSKWYIPKAEEWWWSPTIRVVERVREEETAEAEKEENDAGDGSEG